MNELPLEQILEIVDKVEKWEVPQNHLYETYSGKFSIKPMKIFGKYYIGDIEILKTRKEAIEQGMHEEYVVRIKYDGRQVAGLRGEDAAQVYEKVKELIATGNKPETPLEVKKEALRERVMERFVPKPDKLPFMRRLGR